MADTKRALYLWLVERGEPTDYEQTDGAVVAAETQHRAREILHDEAPGSQDPAVWFLPTTAARMLGLATIDQHQRGSGIILASNTGA